VTLLAVIGIVCVSYALGQYSNFGSGSGGDPFSNPFGDGNGGYNPDNGNGGFNPDNGNGGNNPDNGNGGNNPDNGNGGTSGVLEYAGATSETPAEPNYSGTSSEPDDYSAFSGGEESTCAPGKLCAHGTTSPNIYWIVDNQGTRMQTMNIPRGSRAREELIPAVSGPLVVFEKYPSSQILKYYPGNVQRNKKYSLIFEADTRGRHDCVYWVHGLNGWFSSNIISYNVT